MAPPPEYDKEPKAPDKSATNISTEDSKLLHNLINDQHTNSDHKPTNTAAAVEVENNKHVETLDDGQLRALLDEAITYKCPKDREGKSSLFKELLEEVEQDEQACEAAARTLSGGRGARRGPRGRRALPHSNSLQDLVAALAAEPTPRRAHVRHHAPAPAPSTVSARAIHGGSLPCGVDTSSLLSEEPARAGYLATVRCVNPPPLAERRVSASDANTPAEMELLNRRSKPMFPMTYTARATLEIGSGAVCSGRAVTTTTPSNQVRTPPQARLLQALRPRHARPDGGGMDDQREAEGTNADAPKNANRKPRGPNLLNKRLDNEGKRSSKSDLTIKRSTAKITRKGNRTDDSQLWADNVDNWYKSLANYSYPQYASSIKSRKRNIQAKNTDIPSNPKNIESTNMENNFILPFAITSGPKYSSDLGRQNGFNHSLLTDLPEKDKVNEFKAKESRNLSNVRHKGAHRVVEIYEYDKECDNKLREKYRRQVGAKLVAPRLSDLNPRNVRRMTIGQPLPHIHQASHFIDEHDEAKRPQKTIKKDAKIICSNEMDGSSNSNLNNVTSKLKNIEDINSTKTNRLIDSSMSCCNLTNEGEDIRWLTNPFVYSENDKSQGGEVELAEVNPSHSQNSKIDDSFTEYVSKQQNLLESIGNSEESNYMTTTCEYEKEKICQASNVPDNFKVIGLFNSDVQNNTGQECSKTNCVVKSKIPMNKQDEDTTKSEIKHTITSDNENMKPDEEHIMKPDDEHTMKSDEEHTMKPQDEHTMKSDKGHNMKPDDGHTMKPDNENTMKSDEGHNMKPDDGHTMEPDNVNTMKSDEGHNMKPDDGHTMEPDNENTMKSDEGHTMKPDDEHTMKPDNEHTMKSDEGHTMKPDDEHTMKPDNEHTMKSDEGHTMKPDDEHTMKPDNEHAMKSDEGHTMKPDDEHTMKPNNEHTMKSDEGHNMKPDDEHTMEPDNENTMKSDEGHTMKSDDEYTIKHEVEHTTKSDRIILTQLPNNAYIFLTLPKPLVSLSNSNVNSPVQLHEIENNNDVRPLVSENNRLNIVKKKRQKMPPEHPGSSDMKKSVLDKNVLKVLLFENLFKNNSAENLLLNSGVSAITKDEVDSAISFSCITTPEVVSSCNTTSSTAQSAVAVDPKPRSVISSSFNGLPLSRPNYGSTGTSASDDYKKSLDENGNSVQGFSSPLSGSSQHKKPRRKKSSKNETVIDCQQIDGYQGDKDVNELLRFIESNADHGRGAKLGRVKHKDDSDDKSKKRSSERRKDKESKLKRASSLEELSRTKIEDLTDVPEAALRGDKKERREQPAKVERRSWGDDALYSDVPDSAAAELTDFQTVTKKRKPRRRPDDAPPRRPRAPSPRRQDSAPPSERSNDSNDDMDSVHSLPAAPQPAPPPPPPPVASYADIARTRHNIPDLIESCNFYAEGGGLAPAAPPDADARRGARARPRRGAGPPPARRAAGRGAAAARHGRRHLRLRAQRAAAGRRAAAALRPAARRARARPVRARRPGRAALRAARAARGHGAAAAARGLRGRSVGGRAALRRRQGALLQRVARTVLSVHSAQCWACCVCCVCWVCWRHDSAASGQSSPIRYSRVFKQHVTIVYISKNKQTTLNLSAVPSRRNVV